MAVAGAQLFTTIDNIRCFPGQHWHCEQFRYEMHKFAPLQDNFTMDTYQDTYEVPAT